MGVGAGEGAGGVGVGVGAGEGAGEAAPPVPACPPDAVLPPLVWPLPLFVFALFVLLLCCFTTGFCTVKLYSAVMLSRYVAVMVAFPAAFAVTLPFSSTTAMASSLLS